MPPRIQTWYFEQSPKAHQVGLFRFGPPSEKIAIRYAPAHMSGIEPAVENGVDHRFMGPLHYPVAFKSTAHEWRSFPLLLCPSNENDLEGSRGLAALVDHVAELGPVGDSAALGLVHVLAGDGIAVVLRVVPDVKGGGKVDHVGESTA